MKLWPRCLPVLLIPMLALAAQAPNTQPVSSKPDTVFTSNDEIEEFLRTAKIVKAKGTGLGVTGPLKLTLDDGKVQHCAVFKDIDERKPGMTQLAAGMEIDFKDSWMFEVAAYELDKLLGLGMVPVTIARSYLGRKGSLQFWIDNCMMEGDRLKKSLNPPDPVAWKQQIHKIRVFDNLVYNIDRNLGNLLISEDWKCYMIDHSRTFKNVDQLRSPNDLTYFSRSLMDALEALNEDGLKVKCGRYLTPYEIRTTLKRRDRIVQLYRQAVAERGPATVYS